LPAGSANRSEKGDGVSASEEQQHFALRILSPEGEFFTGQVASAVLHTLAGVIEILPRHEPLLAVLAPGPVTVRGVQDTDERLCTIGTGFVMVTEAGTTVLADSLEAGAPEGE
jgi:F-type H+-transporting ATPase subunit epsilon